VGVLAGVVVLARELIAGTLAVLLAELLAVAWPLS
jgi:hypothetical protein